MATERQFGLEPVAREPPMEYALELNRLIELQMEGQSANDGTCETCKPDEPSADQ